MFPWRDHQKWQKHSSSDQMIWTDLTRGHLDHFFNNFTFFFSPCSASDSGYKRTWQQVKVKHKNIVQTGEDSSWRSGQLSPELRRSFLSHLLPPSAAKRRRAEVMRTDGGSATPSLVSAEDDVLQHRDGRLRVDVLPGAACLEPLVGPDLPFINGRSRRFLIGPCKGTHGQGKTWKSYGIL